MKSKKLQRNSENTMLYLCAYYYLRNMGKFKNSAKGFPSHSDIDKVLADMVGTTDRLPVSILMDQLSITYSAEALSRYRGKRRKKNMQQKQPKKTQNLGTAQMKVQTVSSPYIPSSEFFVTDKWRALRYQALELNGNACQCCGRSRKGHGVVLHVDHIKPRSKFPELSYAINNLQILCEDCNMGKSNKYETDWR